MSALGLWVVWEIASEPPLSVLLLGFVGAWTLAIDFFIHLPREVRAWKASQDAGPRKWPRVPWGLDPISAPAGVAIGLATEWWVGVAVWTLMTAFLWVGWIWTRQFADSGNEYSPRISRVISVGVYALITCLVAVVVIQATSKWGEPGLLAAFLGLGTWSVLMDQFARRREAGEPSRATPPAGR